ncbi:uncharacterized protein IL334_004573 [Kwoniella shivajii]|uniref:Uncharacterized protein n=1 Tax=Kwoniella shivajii TaxID=564305 RepID=A0ABZ1D0P2_9TREE|nr:hypothetical protein IL334_004573 [Kwoniella shivajii]
MKASTSSLHDSQGSPVAGRRPHRDKPLRSDQSQWTSAFGTNVASRTKDTARRKVSFSEVSIGTSKHSSISKSSENKSDAVSTESTSSNFASKSTEKARSSERRSTQSVVRINVNEGFGGWIAKSVGR